MAMYPEGAARGFPFSAHERRPRKPKVIPGVNGMGGGERRGSGGKRRGVGGKEKGKERRTKEKECGKEVGRGKRRRKDGDEEK